MRNTGLVALAFFLILVMLPGTISCKPSTEEKIALNDYMIDSYDPGIKLHLREKYLEGTDKFPGEKIVLFVHGATYPAVPGFDLDIKDYSWMNYVAKRGFAAYALDIRGYGGSTRPPEMDKPASENTPIVRTETAAKDLAAAVEWIRSKHGVPKINIMAWSWGTVISGLYVSQNNDKVNGLVFYAPVYSVKHPMGQALGDPQNPGQPNMKIGAYRITDKQYAAARWQAQIATADKTLWLEPEVMDAWWKAVEESDPTSQTRTPSSIRSPNGVLVDIYYIFTERPIYDASQISVPTLVIRGANDTESTEADARGLFDKLVNVRSKRYVVVGDATHSLVLEKNHMQLLREVQLFLEEVL